MRLYLGGKMIGRPGFDFTVFDKAAKAIRALGYEVFNPAERDRAVGFDPEGTDGSYDEVIRQGFNRREALGADVSWIAERSEGMVALPTWRRSPGTKAEIALHQGLYLPVWELSDFLAEETSAQQIPPLRPGRKMMRGKDDDAA